MAEQPSRKSKTTRRSIALLGYSAEVLRTRQILSGEPVEGWVLPTKKSKCAHMVAIRKAFTAAREAAALPMRSRSTPHGTAWEPTWPQSSA